MSKSTSSPKEASKFKGVTSKTVGGKDPRHEYKRTVSSGKPSFRGSGSQVETISHEPGGEAYSKRNNITRRHASLEEARKHLGWEHE